MKYGKCHSLKDFCSRSSLKFVFSVYWCKSWPSNVWIAVRAVCSIPVAPVILNLDISYQHKLEISPSSNFNVSNCCPGHLKCCGNKKLFITTFIFYSGEAFFWSSIRRRDCFELNFNFEPIPAILNILKIWWRSNSLSRWGDWTSLWSSSRSCICDNFLPTI